MFDLWRSLWPECQGMRLTDARRKLIRAAIRTHTLDGAETLVRGHALSPMHDGTDGNPPKRWFGIHLAFRDSNVETFTNLAREHDAGANEPAGVPIKALAQRWEHLAEEVYSAAAAVTHDGIPPESWPLDPRIKPVGRRHALGLSFLAFHDPLLDMLSTNVAGAKHARRRMAEEYPGNATAAQLAADNERNVRAELRQAYDAEVRKLDAPKPADVYDDNDSIFRTHTTTEVTHATE